MIVYVFVSMHVLVHACARGVRNFMKDREQHKDLAVELGNRSVWVDPFNKRVNFVSALQIV